MTDYPPVSFALFSCDYAPVFAPDQFIKELNQDSYPDYRINIWSKLTSTKCYMLIKNVNFIQVSTFFFKIQVKKKRLA